MQKPPPQGIKELLKSAHGKKRGEIMRVFLADAHSLFRQSLRALLEETNNIEVVGEANNGPDAVTLTKKIHPDVVVMDITIPGYSGLEAVRKIKRCSPEVKVIILSKHLDNVYVNQALKYGALGFVHKDAVYDELIVALDAVEKNRRYLSAAIEKFHKGGDN